MVRSINGEMRRVGVRIKEARQNSDLNSQELAQRCEFAPNTLKRYETDTMSVPLQILIKICENTDTDIAWLTFGGAPTNADKEDRLVQEVVTSVVKLCDSGMDQTKITKIATAAQFARSASTAKGTGFDQEFDTLAELAFFRRQ